MGVVRDYRVLGDDIVVSLSSERQHVAAQGAAGGKRGGLGAFVLNPDMPEEESFQPPAPTSSCPAIPFCVS